MGFGRGDPNQIVGLTTSMIVPPKPLPNGTVFLWPGLQPYGANFLPINNGVLQPVLTWGPSCAPGTQPAAYSTWWVSAQYVNTSGTDPGYTGCQGGPIMAVSPGDQLEMNMVLQGTVWEQTVTDARTGESVTYQIDLQSQSQNFAYFYVEDYNGGLPVADTIFSNTTITYALADPADCALLSKGLNDFVSLPTTTDGGKTCKIARITLRAQGVAATSSP